MAYSSHNLSDTIVALATPQGVGAIGVIRLSGPKAITIVDEVFKSKDLQQQVSHTVHFGTIRDEQDKILDEVLVTLFVAPRSYTGENVVEVSCHGSDFIIQELIRLFIRKGARLAQAGEFTMRAFLNGQMDLSQAEAVADLIASSSAGSHELAMQQMRGGFSNEIAALRQQLIDFASLIELELDFGEEDVEFANRNDLRQLVEKIKSVLRQLIQSFQLGNVIKQGVNTVIAGRPNAGKSTLLNALLNEERAIVSEIAGTTRDTIEEVLNIKGIQFRLIDTAGIREAEDAIEAIGVEKTMEKVRQSSLLVYVFDVIETPPAEVRADLAKLVQEGMHVLVVANKMDLNPYTKWEDYGPTPALPGKGGSSAETALPHQEDRSAETPLPHQGDRSAETPLPHQEESSAETPLPHQEESSAETPLPHQEDRSAEMPLSHQEDSSAETPLPHQGDRSAETPLPHQGDRSAETPLPHQGDRSAETPLPHQGGAGGGSENIWGWKTANPQGYAKVRDYAREMRKEQTPAEEALWERLRKRQVAGHKFLRQHIIGYFITDFYCAKKQLVIEVDGGYHQLPEVELSDQERTVILEANGCQVLRFTNDEIERDIDAVIRTIFRQLTSPLPGEGGAGGGSKRQALQTPSPVDNRAAVLPPRQEGPGVEQNNWVPIIAREGMNVPYLKDKLYEAVLSEKVNADSTIVSNARHYEALENAYEALAAVLEGMDNGITSDFIAMDIRRSLHHLGEITGEISTDDLLGNIFGKFCIGK